MKTIKVKNLLPILTYFFLLSSFTISNAQSNMPIQWQACFGGTDHEISYDIVVTDNGYLIIGNTMSNDGDVSFNHGGRDLWVVNIDSTGDLLWERSYGGSTTDYMGRIISDLKGNYYFVGAVGSNDGDIQSGNHGDYDTWVVKIDETGEIIWERCYGGSGREESPRIKLLSNGNLLVSSNSSSSDGDLPAHYGVFDTWLLEISPVGEILQNEVFGNSMINYIVDIVETADGGYFFLSGTSLAGGMVEGTYHGGVADVWAVKLDSNMDIEWQGLYGGNETDYGTGGLHELSDGYIFLASTDSNDGDVSGFHGGFEDIWAVRINLEGDIIWQKCLGGSESESAGDLQQTEDGGFVVFGTTSSNNGDVSGNHSYPNGWTDIWMVKLNSEGELEWQQCYGGLADETVLSGVIRKSDHDWVIAGSSEYNSYDVNCNMHGEDDFWIFEIKDTTTNNVDYQISDHEIKVYPNPAQDYVLFELNKCPSDGKIQIVNVFGQEMTRIPVKQKKTVWDTRKVKGGFYYYTITCGDLQRTGKLIVK